MTEIELKFQVPPQARAAVRAAVNGRGGAARAVRLQAGYFDTADGRLAAAGVALRLRREGGRWVQTLKAAGADAMTRLEHNVPRRERAAAMPAPDLALHAGTPAGERLAALLGADDAASLHCRYRTDIRRLRRELRRPGGVLELAFDQGRIVAGDAELPVCELEIELLRGTPAVLLAAARTWVTRHGLWLDVRSKAERGTLLATGAQRAPARKAARVEIDAAADLPAARCAVLRECQQQIVVNASQLASGDYGDEHLHQLRVGLRRLRTAFALFAPERAPDESAEVVPDPLDEAAAGLFRALGAARDRAAIAGGPLAQQLAQAMTAAGVALAPPQLAAAGGEDPVGTVRAPAAQALWLDLMAAALPVPADPAAPAARAWLEARLERWQRRVRRGGRGFGELDDERRHQLRKRAKRLRYGVEFARSLFGAGRTARYLRSLAELQDALGAFNDVVVAMDACREAAAHDPSAAFALGWLAARQATCIEGCVPAVARFAEAKRPWKR